MFWDFKKSIERRRIVSVRKSKTGFADACDFSGDVLEGVDRGEEFQRDAYKIIEMYF